MERFRSMRNRVIRMENLQKDTKRVKTAYVYAKENGPSAWNKTCAIKSIYVDGRLLSEIRYDAKSGKWCRSSKKHL